MYRFQLSRNRADRRNALRDAEKFERRFDKNMGKGGYYDIANTIGHLSAQEPMVNLFDRTHQALRRSFGLPPRSILHSSGVFDRDAIGASYDEIEAAIRHQRETHEIRDLSGFGTWLLLAGFGLQLVGALMAN